MAISEGEGNGEKAKVESRTRFNICNCSQSPVLLEVNDVRRIANPPLYSEGYYSRYIDRISCPIIGG
jgi:hypothetical protein